MIGIIGAMDIEVSGMISEMTDRKTETISGNTYTCGTIHGKDCVIVKCGIGKVNAAVAAQTMILRYAPKCIINTGIAGSTSLTTHIGHVVIAESVIQHDMDTTALGDKQGTIFFSDGSIDYIPCDKTLVTELEAACRAIGEDNFTVGTVATGDQFIVGNERRYALNRQFHAIACEMEGGSIGQVCFLNKVPFAILRSISDSMSDEDDAVEYTTFSRCAAKKSIDILLAFLKRADT